MSELLHFYSVYFNESNTMSKLLDFYSILRSLTQCPNFLIFTVF